MEATTIENVATRELTDNVWLVTDTRHGDRTFWYIQEGPEAQPLSGVHQASVELLHPRIENNVYRENPLIEGRVKIKTNQSVYYSRDDYIYMNRAKAVGEALLEAIKKNDALYKELKPQVAERLKEIERQRKEREERRRKYEESQAKRAELRTKIREKEQEFYQQFAEAIQWYEGQAGRIKRAGKAGVNRFSAMGYVRGGTLYWTGMSGRTHSDAVKNIKWIEIRYESERSTERIELPKYPKEEIDKLNEELGKLTTLY